MGGRFRSPIKNQSMKTKPKTNENVKVFNSVADMMVQDVWKSQQFFDQVAADLSRIWNEREEARKKLKETKERLKVHPIDHLHKAGLMDPGEFIVIYAKIFNSVLVGLPAAQREVIKIIGNASYNSTIITLLNLEAEGAKDEKKRNRRKRKSND